MSSDSLDHPRYFQAHQQAPFFFHLKIDNIDDDIAFVKKHGITNIALNQYAPYLITSLDIIPREVKPIIRKLKIFIKNANLSGLKEFQSLEDLSIGEKATDIDLTDLKFLSSLYIVFSDKISGLNSLTRLKSITIIKSKPNLFSFFSFEEVEEISLYGGSIPSNLLLLNPSGKLKRLDLCGIRTEADLEGILAPNNELQSLKIEKCKNLTGLERILSRATELIELSLIDSMTLEDTRFISKLSNLKTLIVLGSSYFINGDLNDLKKLDWVSIDDKRHYNVRHNSLGKKPVCR